MILGIIKTLWGDLTREEYKKFGILAGAMMLIIGNYWMLRVTKDALFSHFVGFEKYQPIAKMISPFIMFAVVLAYSKLIDLLKKSHLIYLMCGFYGLSFIILSFFIANPHLATISPTSIFYPMVSWIPGKGIGWFIYLLLETYGSLLIALFYSFIASVMTADLAKKGYGFLFVFIQFSTVIGILIAQFLVKRMGFAPVYLLGGIFVLIAPFFTRLYSSVFPADVKKKKEQAKADKKKTGFFAGVKLIITRPYVMGIFVVASFYEIISTIIEYQMGKTALMSLTTQQFAVFKGYQGMGINLLSFTFVFIGATSFFMRKFGLKFCLITFPVAIGTVVLASYSCHLFGIENQYFMWILLGASVAIKGLNYALNKPASEVMYIPTSKDVKFKSKGWIDMFGLRATKAVGAGVNSIAPLLIYGTIVSFGVVAVWVFIAAFVGNKFNELQRDNKIVE